MSDITSDEVQRQVNKRLMLNLLIQGASGHTSLTAHHLVREELESIRRGLPRLYDRFAICLGLNYFFGDFFLMLGLPSKFWRRADGGDHPFHHCGLLRKHGSELYRSAKRRLKARGWRRWVFGIPVIHLVQMLWIIVRLAWVERRHRPQLVRLAKYANSQMWGIDEDRMDAAITTKVAFGHLKPPRTTLGEGMRNSAVGYGGVERTAGQFMVVGKGWNFGLVLAELSKGTAELVCLHGLNTLDDETYKAVTDEADQIEFEVWMLQVGPELWRRLLAVLPSDRTIAEMLMHIARLDPEPMEELLTAVVEEPARAREMLEVMV